MKIIRKMERKCRLPEGTLVPIAMMFGGFGVMLTSTAFPEDSDTSTGFICTGAGSMFAGMMRLICLDNSRQFEAEQRQQLLAQQRNPATLEPPPPTIIAPSAVPKVSVTVLGRENELKPMRPNMETPRPT